MAWTTKSRIIQRRHQLIVNWAGQADASDLTAQVIVDLSAYALPSGTTPTWSRIEQGLIVVDGMSFRLEWDHDTNDLIVGGGSGHYLIPYVMFPPAADIHTEEAQPNLDPKSSGSTGDIVLTTSGGGAGEGISIQMLVSLFA